MKRKPADHSHRTPDGRSQRQLRVGEAIRHELSAILMRGDFRDPDLQDITITVTEVRVSPDLRNASAFIAPLGGERAREALAGLKRAAPHLRSMIGKALRLRYIPSIRFEYDDSFDQANRIETLLKAPEVMRDLERPDRDGEADTARATDAGATPVTDRDRVAEPVTTTGPKRDDAGGT